MSYNLEVNVKKEGGEDAVLLLVGFGRGITHSASVSMGETICFLPQSSSPISPINVKVTEIHHEWQSPGSQRAPNSVAYGEVEHQLSERELGALLSMGFQEI